MKKKPTPDELNFKVLRLSHLVKNRFRKVLSEQGMFVGQHRLLMCVIDDDGPTAAEIAESLKITPATVSVSIKRMEKAGLIKKEQCRNDARTVKIFATQKGFKSAENVHAEIMKIEEKICTGFSSSETALFKSFLDRAISNFSDEDEEEAF